MTLKLLFGPFLYVVPVTDKRPRNASERAQSSLAVLEVLFPGTQLQTELQQVVHRQRGIADPGSGRCSSRTALVHLLYRPPVEYADQAVSPPPDQVLRLQVSKVLRSN